MGLLNTTIFTPHVDDDLVRLVERFEGVKLISYKDCVGVWTIGAGHTNNAGGFKFGPGTQITKEQADAILRDDLERFARKIWPLFKRRPTAGQWAAMLSLAFNIGPTAFAKSTRFAILFLYGRYGKQEPSTGRMNMEIILFRDGDGGSII